MLAYVLPMSPAGSTKVRILRIEVLSWLSTVRIVVERIDSMLLILHELVVVVGGRSLCSLMIRLSLDRKSCRSSPRLTILRVVDL
jgi:hypothetical protein